MSNKHKNPTISFQISDAERKQIEVRILISGMKKKDYFTRSCIYNRICVVGMKETIYDLYRQLQVMQNAFLDATAANLPTSDDITSLQTDYENMLIAIIDMLDGAKYLWEGGTSHE